MMTGLKNGIFSNFPKGSQRHRSKDIELQCWIQPSLSSPRPYSSSSTRRPPAEEIRENEREDRVAVVVHAIDLLAALGEVLFKFPEIGRLLNLRGLAFGF